MSNPVIELRLARAMAREGNIDGAIDHAQKVDDELTPSGGLVRHGLSTTVPIELPLHGKAAGDPDRAQ